MGSRLSYIWKIIGIIFIVLVIHNEYFIYIKNSWTWSKLNCKNKSNCLKILLVADPQLIGEVNEIYHSITPISILDSDRYLKKTYSKVVNHFSPDVIIFLGDLFDEGSIANTAQYIRYVKRFFSIFNTEYPISHIWLPGDNDIGGENFDRVTPEKIKRFENTFSQPPIIDVKHVRFNKINRMIRYPLPFSTNYIDNNEKTDDKMSVIVSHMPLVLIPASFVEKVLKLLEPKIVFAAHEHKSRIVRTNLWQQYRRVDDLIEHNQIYEYKLDKDKVFEILAPTCSYRMGTTQVGYGAAIIEANETLRYTVFWSPNRFTYLYSYFILTVLTMTYFLLTHIYKKLYRPRIISISKQHFPYRIIKNGV